MIPHTKPVPKAFTQAYTENVLSGKNKLMWLQLFLHFADVSNPLHFAGKKSSERNPTPCGPQCFIAVASQEALPNLSRLGLARVGRVLRARRRGATWICSQPVEETEHAFRKESWEFLLVC